MYYNIDSNYDYYITYEFIINTDVVLLEFETHGKSLDII